MTDRAQSGWFGDVRGAAALALRYKIVAVAIECVAFLCFFTWQAMSRPIPDLGLLENLEGIVSLSLSATAVMELLGMNVLLSWLVVFAAALSRFHPAVTGFAAGLCMVPYWTVVHGDWPVMSWTVFFVALGLALALTAAWLSVRARRGLEDRAEPAPAVV